MMAVGNILLLLLCLVPVLTDAIAADCPNDWVAFRNSCYLFNIHTLQKPLFTWEESRAYCLGYDGDLVSILDSSEVDFIYSQTSKLGNFLYWIGLYRNTSTTTKNPKEGWIWMDGNNFTTNQAQWSWGEPNNYNNNEQCAELYGKHKKWNDNDCNKKMASICKRDKGKPMPTSMNTTVPPTTEKPPPCDHGWEGYGKSCYKFSDVYNYKSWGDAQKACRDTGGHLLTIDDADEQNYFTLTTRKHYRPFWIGLNSLEVNNRWVWESQPRKQVTFANWQSGEPNSFNGQEKCVEMLAYTQAGFWNDAACTGRKKFICEKENGLNMCPDNWVPYGDNCYQFNLGSSQQLTWAAAKNACEATGGSTTLVTIKNQDEQTFLTKRAQSSEVWIGLSDAKTETIFKWVDGSLLSESNFSIWANIKPTENRDDKDCVALLGISSNGAWFLEKCALKRGFICKRHRDLSFCNVPIGMENGDIPDSQITASSSSSLANGPEKARYRRGGSWCSAQNDKKAFIQVDLGSLYTIKKIIVEGNVTLFAIRYSKDGKTFRDYQGVLTTDSKLDALQARVVKVYPRARHGRQCLTMELVGCVAQIDDGNSCSGKNWEMVNGLCYQINRNYQTWTDARSVCLDQGGDLLTLRTPNEKNGIATRIRRIIGISDYWIALNDRDYIDFMFWSNNDENSLESWSSGSPSVPKTDKYNLKSCVKMSSSTGRWTDVDCNERRPFICMKRIPGQRSSSGNVVTYSPTGVWINSAKYYWPLNDARIGTTPGTVYGTVKQIPGIKNKKNTAVQFSSSGSYIDVGDFSKNCLTYPEACSNGLTLSFMASFDATAARWQTRVNIIDSVGDETNSVGLAVYVTNQQLSFVVSKAYKILTSSVAISGDQTWRHYVLRYNETGIFISINGKLITTRTTSRTVALRGDQQTHLLIGLQKSPSIKSGQVNLAMVAFWELVLSESDINTIYTAEFGRCPFGWTAFGMSCYQFNRDAKSNDKASMTCQSRDGDLVSIQSPVEQSFITQHILKDSWIGVRDVVEEGAHVQPNGEYITYSNWNLWEPNDVGNEDCTEVKASDGLWNDLSCYWPRSYICEKAKDLIPKNTTVITKFERVCQYSRVSIGCPEEFVIKINNAFWGRTRRDLCVQISVASCGVKETAATTKTVQGLCDNAPSCNLHASESVLGSPCKSVSKYLEVNYTCVPEKTTTKCPAGWKLSLDSKSCYGLFDTPKTWQDAQTACEQASSKLVSIGSSQDQSLLTSLMARAWYMSVWTGLNDLNTKGIYEWSDGLPVSWTNWYVGQPDERRTDNSCVYMSLKGSKRTWMFWRDSNCSNTLPFMCKKMLVSPKKPTTSSPVVTDACPSGWIERPNSKSCYQVISARKTWLEARKHCQELVVGYSRLTSIGDDAENKFVQKLSNSTFWIGLEARGVLRGHVWSDDRPVSYTNWDIGQPDSANGLEACVQFNPDTGMWSDVSCNTPKEFICKRPKKKAAPTAMPTIYPSPGSNYCKQGWTLFDGMCYIAGNNSELITWHDAEAKCKSMNGHLTSITSEREQTFIAYLIKDKKVGTFSIGLNDLGSEGLYKWSDGNPYGEYLNWIINEPNDHTRQEDCVHLIKTLNKWNDNHCSAKVSYICKSYNESYYPAITSGPPFPANGYCPPGWVVNGQWCYEFHTDSSEYRTWYAAREACEKGTNSSSSGELVSIANGLEEAFVTIHIHGAKVPLWIGMNNFHPPSMYVWIDNSPSKYYNWNPNSRPYPWGRQCVEILPSRHAAGKWNAAPCSKTQGYICKKRSSRTPVTPTTLPYTPTPSGAPDFTCPQGYKSYQDSCYKFVKNSPKTFDKAREACKDEGAKLITIDSAFKQAYLVYTLERYVGNVWIGLVHEPYSTFKFPDHALLVYSYWGTNEPNRQLAQRSCAKVNISDFANWHDVDCNLRHSYLCEIYKGEPKITIPLNATCSKGWLQYDNHCYKYFPISKQWSTAQYSCSILGSDLLSIHDDREQDFILHNFKFTNHGYYGNMAWIGLNDRNVEHGFQWSDGSSVPYINWNTAVNAPNGLSRENCVSMSTITGQWDDLHCSRYSSYICKSDLYCSSVLQVEPSMITVTESSNATSLGVNQAIIQDGSSNDLAWCTNNTSGNARIEIDFGRLVRVRSIALQGRHNPVQQFVKLFRVDYATDNEWKQYTYMGGHTMLHGNTDARNIVKRSLKPTIGLDTIAITPLTWTPAKQICLKIRLYGCDYVCQRKLILPPGRLLDGAIVASSAKYPKNGPKQASERGNTWCAERNDIKQWLQVYFHDNDRFISKIITYGDGYDSYVKSYKLLFSADGITWIEYQQYGVTRIFQGNRDVKTKMYHTLANPIEAPYIRLIPLTWQNNICLRLQLRGCHADCGKPLLNNGQENSEVEFSSSAPKSNPQYAVFSSGKAWCTNKTPLTEQYLQIEFPRNMRLIKIATQGSPQGYGKPRAVSSFTISRWKSGSFWQQIVEPVNKHAREYVAVDVTNPSKPMVNLITNIKGISTTKIRIYPKQFDGEEICMRVEVYGCITGAEIIPTTEPTKQNVVDVSFRITSMEWNDKLSDKKSEEFANAKKQIENAVGGLYEEQTTSYRSATVKELKKGSVIALLELVFNPEFSENVTEPLQQAIKQGKIGSLEVDPTYFRVIETSPRAYTGDSPSGLTGGAVAGIVITLLLLFAVALAAGFLFYRRKKRKDLFTPQHFENPISYSSKAYDMDD